MYAAQIDSSRKELVTTTRSRNRAEIHSDLLFTDVIINGWRI